MFYMKGDDMEEMFRKAADGYDLNEEMAADWNKINTALQDDATSVVSAKQEKKRRKYFWVWMFLAVGLLSLLTYKTAFYFSGKERNAKPEAITKKDLSSANDLKDDQNSTQKKSKNNTAVVLNSASLNGLNNIKKLSEKNKFSIKTNHLFPEVNNSNSGIIYNDIASSNNSNQNKNSLPQQERTTGNHQQETENTSDNYSFNNSKLNNNLTDNKTAVVLDNKTNASQQSNPKQKIKTNNYTRQSFAYASLTGNADVSFVKFQKTSALGFGLGITGGYHFKNGISLETGLLYDKKSYYTKGEYFDTKNLPYLQYVNLISANGNCNMWEIPVNIKYDFNSQKKYNFFVTAGLSSYLMKKEFYNFKYEMNGVTGEKAYDYYHASQNWFSVLNLGGGINIKTSNRYFLQVQPYYKIPISGVGKGNLSLSSAGINLSLIKRFK